MKLVPLMTFHVLVAPPFDIGDTSRGKRLVANISGGAFEGDRLRGTICESGADWIVIDNDNIGHIDVRIVLKTDDDAHIYAHYTGFLEYNDKFVNAALSGGETQVGDSYFMNQIRFETGAEKYKWLNKVLAVGEGRVYPGGIWYRVFEQTHD